MHYGFLVSSMSNMETISSKQFLSVTKTVKIGHLQINFKFKKQTKGRISTCMRFIDTKFLCII